MDTTAIIEFLKKELSIEVEQEIGNYNEKHTTIKIIIDGETISEASLDIDL